MSTNADFSWRYQADTLVDPALSGMNGLHFVMIAVVFDAVEGDINDRIDDAYRAKYAASPYLKPMISSSARAATVRISPKS